MSNFIKIATFLAVISFVSCKKNRICQCTNSNGTYDAGETESTKKRAKKDCADLSTDETTCKLKED